MSDYYDTSYNYRWDTLAEFHFNLNDDEEPCEDEYFYCLCSRILIRDKVCHIEKDASESDLDTTRESKNNEFEDQSHVHFSTDTSYKVKCEKDENASCYCSASHTDNYCSTDEHDPAQPHGTTSHTLQTSDSGADLTYQECHDYSQYKFEKMEQDQPSTTETNENYFSEDTWDKFWGINGERLIWASWIKKYSNYINPAYLDENNDLLLDDNNTPMEVAKENVNKDFDFNHKLEEDIRERKFSYDSKVNPYRKVHGHNQGDKCEKMISCQDNTFTPINRRRSCSEHERMLSPRTLATSDSMTNVTKLTMSSYDVTSSHVTSNSTPTDDYSVSTSTSDDQNDQTRIANFEENFDFIPTNEVDSEEYWQLLWKKHFGEQYALHYELYVQCHTPQNTVLPTINVETYSDTVNEKVQEIEYENSEGYSQETPTVMEKTQPDKPKTDKTKAEVKKPQKRRNNKAGFKYIDSVGVLLQNLLLEEQKKVETNEPVDGGDEKNNKKDKTESTDQVDGSVSSTRTTIEQSKDLYRDFNDDDDDPPEEKPFTLKRSHELDEEETADRINTTFEIMGFSITPNKMPKGSLVYKRRNAVLRGPKNKKMAKKIYFDYDGNPYQAGESQDEREIVTDDVCLDSTDAEINVTNDSNVELENEEMDNTSNLSEAEEDKDDLISDNGEDDQNSMSEGEELVAEKKARYLRRRNAKMASKDEVAKMPPELNGDPAMYKYWVKRFSLLSRYDEGCLLDRESWFSITPEKVAQHIAQKSNAYPVILDAFCGAGGNTIQFAKVCKKVIAVDIDPKKIELAKHNAAIYGVLHKIEFVVGDFFELASELKADFVFLSPPWGGPNYTQTAHYDLESMLEPKPISELMKMAFSISNNVGLYVPRNTMVNQLLDISKTYGCDIEIEQNYIERRYVAISAYYNITSQIEN